MDIHRCRFVPYQPQSVNALAFSHTNSRHRTPTDLRLALGRENGDIEIWNPSNGNWVQEKLLRGSRDRTVEQLAWTQDLIVDEDNKERPIDDGNLRLFSSGGSTSITEWDLSTGTQKRHAEGNFGEIWCFAAQPQWRATTKVSGLAQVAAASSQMLVAGCADGTIVLFSTVDDSLQYLRILASPPAKKSKALSITWQNRNTVVAGYEDGTIRVIDVPKRSVVRTMSLGRSSQGDNIVWTVKCLPDGTILSGDSAGELRFWDSESYSLIQRLKSHDADILDIAFSKAGDLIFTAGVDRRTVVYQPEAGQSGKRQGRWQQVIHRRFHQHDVKALASFESKEMSILVSGGMDTVLNVVPLRHFDTEYHRALPYLPHKPQMSCSSRSRLMLTWWDRDLFIWRLPDRYVESAEDPMTMSKPEDRKLLAKLQLSSDESITSAEISPSGDFIVAATVAEVRFFHIRKRIATGEVEIRSRQLHLPAGIRTSGALLAGFSPDSKWLYTVSSSNVITLVKVVSGTTAKDHPTFNERVIKLGRKSRRIHTGKLGDYRRTINCVAFSSDSRILSSGDLSGSVDVWILEGQENLEERATTDPKHDSGKEPESPSDSDSDTDDESDSSIIHGQKWIRNPAGATLPQLDSGILALSFKPLSAVSKASQLPVVGLHATRHNPNPISHDFPPPSTLVAVTTNHSLVEFDVLSARLSNWSRRNPSSCLPSQFKQLKERLKGLFWDCSSSNTRLYLYGSTFLFMLDMGQDLNVVDSRDKIGKLGKYDVRDKLPKVLEKESTGEVRDDNVSTQTDGMPRKRRKMNTGAGDSIRQGEWQARDIITANNGFKSFADDMMDLDTGLPSPTSQQDEDDDDDMEEDVDISGSALAGLRRQDNDHAMPNLTDKSEAPEQGHVRSASQTVVETESSPRYVLVNRYRAIFGISSLTSPCLVTSNQPGSRTESETDLDVSAPEIVIVERPLYDIELVPRFDGGQDW